MRNERRDRPTDQVHRSCASRIATRKDQPIASNGAHALRIAHCETGNTTDPANRVRAPLYPCCMLDITRPDARVAALGGLIDYAGLFPPADLGMADAVAEYRAARAGAEAWMVERFLCPVGRLEELAAVLMPTMASGEAA